MACFNCGEPSHIASGCPYPRPRARTGTYLAEIEDSEGDPMAIRVPLDIIPTVRPPCQHKHSRLCAHGNAS